jgi:hypothetical protein
MRSAFACTLGLSALLMFVVQPMIGRALLPLLGGAPAVWTTTMLFFQAALLLGYGWAHGAERWLPWRAQVGLHLLLLASGLAVLPFTTAGATPMTGAGIEPAVWLAGFLAVAIGLPVVALSASAPLLQGWIVRAGDREPYALYAASNAGSLLALLGYPIVIEPFVGVAAQARGWRVGYGLLLAAIAACAWLAHRRGAATAVVEAEAAPAAPLEARQVARWLALSAVPVCLLLGVTTHITTELTSAPLLWIAPLAVYLVTFILAFDDRRGPASARRGSWALMLLAAPLVLVVAVDASPPLWAALPLDLGALLAGGLACHGRLAKERPPVQQLTAFYLCVAAGGVVGGLLCAIVAPLVLTRVLEYPLAVAAACLLRPVPAPSPDDPPPPPAGRALALDVAWPVAVGLLALGVDALVRALPALDAALRRPDLARLRMVLLFAPAALVAHAASRRPRRHALALTALLLGGLLVEGAHGKVVRGERSFFGVLRVTISPDGGQRWLVHGGTVHGAQWLDPARQDDPLTYYHRQGPCGDLVAAWRTRGVPGKVGVVGLGVGALAAYAAPGEDWTFYEIDPAVERIARDPALFTFLTRCKADWRVVGGDARLSLAGSAGAYGLLFMDAFSGDAVPAHLLTEEALGLQAAALAPGGLLAFHVSNRYLTLEPVVARAAARAGLVARTRLDHGDGRVGRSASRWIALARRDEDFGPLRTDPQWTPLPADAEAPWTDDHANLLGALLDSTR